MRVFMAANRWHFRNYLYYHYHLGHNRYTHSPPSGAKNRNKWKYTSTPPHAFHGVCKDNTLMSYNIRPIRKDIFPIQALYKYNRDKRQYATKICAVCYSGVDNFVIRWQSFELVPLKFKYRGSFSHITFILVM